MFTGIIEELGTVAALDPHAAGARLGGAMPDGARDAREGSSIAVNGVCLTALALTADSFAADLAPETLARTNLGDLRAGSRVNLERPVTPGDAPFRPHRAGHVDATGELVSLETLGDGNWWLKVRVPARARPLPGAKGSIAIDGISLTIASLEKARSTAARSSASPSFRTPTRTRRWASPSRARGSTSKWTCWRSTWKSCWRQIARESTGIAGSPASRLSAAFPSAVRRHRLRSGLRLACAWCSRSQRDLLPGDRLSV